MGLCLGGLSRVVTLVCLGIVHQSPSLCQDKRGVKGLEVYEFCAKAVVESNWPAKAGYRWMAEDVRT